MGKPYERAKTVGKVLGLLIANVVGLIIFVVVGTSTGFWLWGGTGGMVGMLASLFLGVVFLLAVDLFLIFGGLDWIRRLATDESDEDSVEPAD